MTEDKKNDKNNAPSENLFQILEGVIHQVNNTKKIFTGLLIINLVVLPLISVFVFGPPHLTPSEYLSKHSSGMLLPIIPILFGIMCVVIVVRQWLILSKWTKKFAQYRELEKKIDEKLDYDDDIDEK